MKEVKVEKGNQERGRGKGGEGVKVVMVVVKWQSKNL